MKVHGLDKVLRNVDKADEAIKKSAAETVEKAALEIEAEAVFLVPVDTGRLKDSIQEEKITDLSRRVGTDVEYAGFVEFGTKHQAAQPYLRPAADKVGSKYPKIVRQGIALEIKKAGIT
jgi:HK97 gp10 family phage protein